MVFEGAISPVWQLALAVGLGAFFAFFLYVILFPPARFVKAGSGSLHNYERAWWNHKVVLWAFFILFVATEGAFLAGSALSLLFGGFPLFRRPFRFAVGMASDNPLLSILFMAIHAPIASFILLLLLLATMSRSGRGVWLARHFTQALVVITVFLLTLQGIGVFLLLERSAGG